MQIDTIPPSRRQDSSLRRQAPLSPLQIFLTFFKTLEGKEVTVELKNDLCMRGTLDSVDQYLNLKLSAVSVVEKERFPQLVSCCFP